MNASIPAYVIINPASRSGYALRLWNQLAPLFRSAGISCRPLLSSPQRSIRDIAAGVCVPGEEINLLVLGGDGTLNETINGIRDFSSVNLGYIPVGSASDFGKALGITDPQEAVRTILSAEGTILRDLGIVTYYMEGKPEPASRCFTISAGMGFDADCCYLSDHTRLKKILNRLRLGSLIYLTSAARLIAVNRLTCHTVSIDHAATYQFPRTLFTVCMNTCYEGGGFQFCPDADPSDGKLELCNADGIGRLGFLHLFPKAYSGAHIGCRGITALSGTDIIIESNLPQHFHADGEVIEEKVTRLEITILPRCVRWLL